MEEFKEILDKIEGERDPEELNSIWSKLEYTKDDPEYTALKFNELRQQIQRYRSRKIRRMYVIASSVAAVFLFSALVYFIDNNEESQTVAYSYKEIGLPALSSNVVITVNGESINLNSKSASITQNDSITSIVSEDGKTIKDIDKNTILSVKVPSGHQFSMSLSDGTKVWLNSESELTYPSTFVGSQRKVKIKGEAFFDVTKDKNRPFIVSVNDKYDVKVLGTKFNVDSYADCEMSRTTLVDGKIAVRFKGDDNEVILEPSEQMSIDSMNCVEVGTVNTEEFTSWRERRFVFDNERLSDIAVKMKRCYGIDIFVGEHCRNLRFSGRVSYDRGIDYFIKVLKDTEGIRCELSHGKLLIGVNK